MNNLKKAIHEMIHSWDYSWVISIFNQRWWFLWITIEIVNNFDNEQEKLILVHNEKFLVIDKQKLQSYLVAMITCDILQENDLFTVSSLSKKTYKYRWKYIKPYKGSWSSSTHEWWIFSCYTYNDQSVNNVENMIQCLFLTKQMQSIKWSDFVNFKPVSNELFLNDEEINKQIDVVKFINNLDINKEQYIEMFINTIISIKNLSFIDKDRTTIEDWRIIFKIKPYKIKIWTFQWNTIELWMPWIYVVFSLSSSSYYIYNHTSYIHPHVNNDGIICFGTYADYIRTNRHDVESCLINIYDLLSYFNKKSVYWSFSPQIYNRTWDYFKEHLKDWDLDYKWLYFNWEKISFEDFRESQLRDEYKFLF